MQRPTTQPLGIARDFLTGAITPFDIRTNDSLYSNRTRGVVVLTVLTHYGILKFNRHKTQLHPIISALFPVVFRKDGRCFKNEFPIYNEGTLDSRLVSFNPYAIAGFLHRAGLSRTTGGRGSNITTTLMPPAKLPLLIAHYSKNEAIAAFVRTGNNAKALLAQAKL